MHKNKKSSPVPIHSHSSQPALDQLLREGLLALSLALLLALLVTGGNRQALVSPQPAARPKSSRRSSEPKEVAPPAPADLTQLAADRNHSLAAEAYAYKAGEIQAIMDGNRQHSGDKLVFLTFDDGPNWTITPQILDILAEEGVPATFFVLGKHVNEDTRPILERQIREGHAIGSHSFSHSYEHLYPGRQGHSDRIVSEHLECLAALRAQLGEDFHTRVFRYPGGHMSWSGLGPADQSLQQMGCEWIDWNASNGDALPASQAPSRPSEMAAYHENNLPNFPDHGCRVVLMHDAMGKDLTVAALPQIIRYYKDAGYTFGVLK